MHQLQEIKGLFDFWSVQLIKARDTNEIKCAEQ